MRHPRNATPFPVLRYSELRRRMQLRGVFQRIQALRNAIKTADQELSRLEAVVIGKGGAA